MSFTQNIPSRFHMRAQTAKYPPLSYVLNYARAARRLCLNRKTTLCAALLIAVGAALRLYALGDVPPGVWQDEASGAYDAWALLHYGIDRNGNSWPVNFVSWGSGQSALYAYIAMPFIWFAGLDIIAFRLPMAISGIAALWLMWRIAHNAGGDKFALIALLFLALSPWHVMASRWGFNPNMLPFTVLLSVYFLSRHDRHRFGVQAAAVGALSISVYAYETAYAFAPMFLGAAFGWLALNGALTLRRLFALSAIAAAIAAPVIAFLIVNLFDLDTIRVLGVTIPRYTGPARYETITLLSGGDWERGGFISNIEETARLLVGYVKYNIVSVMPEWGALPRFSIIIAAAGVGVAAYRAIARGDYGVHLIVALWLVLALAVAALSDAEVHRMNLVWLPAIYLTALGLSALRLLRASLYAAVAAFVALGGVFAYQYFGEYKTAVAAHFHDGLNAAIDRAIENSDKEELIYITERRGTPPYAQALFSASTSPHRYLETRVMTNPSKEFQRVIAFDRFIFLSPFRHQKLRRAGPNIQGVEHYIFTISRESEDIKTLDADKFAFERYGLHLYAYPKDGGSGGAAALNFDEPLVQGEPAASSEFDLHLQDGELIYFKQPCDQYDTRERFFLHIVPADIKDLPDERRAHGFDNLDFWFWQRGDLYGRQCVAHLPLPDYPIAAIETGQTKQAREWPAFWRQSWNRLWTAELKF